MAAGPVTSYRHPDDHPRTRRRRGTDRHRPPGRRLTVVELLLSVAAAVLVAAVLLLALGGLTVVPWVVALGLAERRGFDVVRCGLVGAGCALGGLGAALSGYRAGMPAPLLLLAVASTWAGPALVLLVARVAPRLAGRGGRHEA